MIAHQKPCGKDHSLADREMALRALRRAAARRFPDLKMVFGEGAADARIMIVGEAPGREEELLGRPFVGPAGRMLQELLRGAGITRADVYMTNVVKARPMRRTGEHVATRAPSSREIAEHLPLLYEEVAIVCPEVIICCGGVAAGALIHHNFNLMSERGRWYDGPGGVRCIATFHPAYVRRFGRGSNNRLLAVVREDLAAAREAARPR